VRYLLDTCTFLWMAQQPTMLSATARGTLDDGTAELFVSDASIWEIMLKHSVGKLPLPDAPRHWIPRKFVYHRLQPLPLTREAIFRSGELPRTHADPFDRMLVAQAMAEPMFLLTSDRMLAGYGDLVRLV